MLNVVCAIIQYDNKILIAQRSEQMALPLKWEFPGGKVKEGENKQAALKREIKEELAMDIEVGEALEPVEYHYENFSIALYPFLCTCSSGDFVKKEHREIHWERLENLMDYDWAAADVPVVEELITEFKRI